MGAVIISLANTKRRARYALLFLLCELGNQHPVLQRKLVSDLNVQLPSILYANTQLMVGLQARLYGVQ